MTDDSLQHLAIGVATLVATVAAVKVQIKEICRRVDSLEDCESKLDERFVPRRELMALLQVIKETAEQTNRIVRRNARKRERENV